MKKIFVCSPLRGNVKENIANAKRYCKIVINDGNIPIAPHLYFPIFLDDNKEEERELGIKMGLCLLDSCDEMWVFGETISSGMKQEIEYWEKKKGVVYVRNK